MTRQFTYNTATLSANYSHRTQVQCPGGEWVSYSYGLSYEPNGWISWMVSSNGNTNLPDPGVNNVDQAPRGVKQTVVRRISSASGPIARACREPVEGLQSANCKLQIANWGRGGGGASVGYDPTSTWIISRDAFAGCWFLG